MSDVTGTIHADVSTERSFDGDEAVDAFLKDMHSDEYKAPSSDTTEAPEVEQGETAPTTEEKTESEPTTDPNDPDEQEFEVKVGEEVHKPKLKELKRLFGQEAALTQKSQKATETLKSAEQREQLAHAALTRLTEKAEARYKEYAGLDMLVLAQRMDTQEFQALRQDAQAAEAEVKFLKEELGQHVQQAQQRAQQAYREAAQASWKELSDPEKGIKGWNQEVYQNLSQWAAAQGAHAAKDMVDPAAWRILHMAYSYAKQQEAAKTAEEKAQKGRNKPTTVITPKGGRGDKPVDTKASALRNLRSSGSIDDATSAFMA